MDFVKELRKSIKKTHLPPRIILNRFSFIDEDSKTSQAYMDHRYLLFYYHLGKIFKADSVIDVGFGLGLMSACYFMANPDVEHYLALQEPIDFYSSKIGITNVKLVYKKPFNVIVGKFTDEKFIGKLKYRKWQLSWISEKRDYDTTLLWLNNLWENNSGLICLDRVSSEDSCRRAYRDFCKMKGQEQTIIETRYGTGLLWKNGI